MQGVAWDRGHGIKAGGGLAGRRQDLEAGEAGQGPGPLRVPAFSFARARLRRDNVVSSRATNNAGETQVDKLKFNPAGYHNNVPLSVSVTLA